MDQVTNKLETLMLDIGGNAKQAAARLATSTSDQKNTALTAMAKHVRLMTDDIVEANRQDIELATKNGRDQAFLDRLMLNEARIESIAKALEDIAALPDPVGHIMDEWERPNGLKIARMRVPIGVIGIIYESRPNVTADAGALSMKAGNAAILRGGSESLASSLAIHKALVAGLEEAGLPEHSIQLVPVADRDAVGAMLRGLDGTVDVIVPRGGKSLVARVEEDARVPVFSHLEGICHVYVEKSADLDMSRNIVLNAKLRRTGICGAAETLLVDRNAKESHLAPLLKALLDEGCEVRGDDEVRTLDARIKPATDEDWDTEYLDAIISAKLVENSDEAIAHIAQHSSHHTEAIVTEDQAVADKFFTHVDSAILLHNASTQFADGGEFGMGAEIGIATGKMHARGPVGLEQLTSFKYIVRGSGQTRPT